MRTGRRCSALRTRAEQGRPKELLREARAPGWRRHRSRPIEYAHAAICICHRVGPPRTRAQGRGGGSSGDGKWISVQYIEFTNTLGRLREFASCGIKATNRIYGSQDCGAASRSGAGPPAECVRKAGISRGGERSLHWAVFARGLDVIGFAGGHTREPAERSLRSI
jgi:hypothetical protein